MTSERGGRLPFWREDTASPRVTTRKLRAIIAVRRSKRRASISSGNRASAVGRTRWKRRIVRRRWPSMSASPNARRFAAATSVSLARIRRPLTRCGRRLDQGDQDPAAQVPEDLVPADDLLERSPDQKEQAVEHQIVRVLAQVLESIHAQAGGGREARD